MENFCILTTVSSVIEGDGERCEKGNTFFEQAHVKNADAAQTF